MKRKDWFTLALGMGLIILLSGCPDEPELSSEALITAFIFQAAANDGLDTNVTADIDGNSISLEVPHDTGLKRLIPEITVSESASVEPAGGVPRDFSSPVTYTVTAEDGITTVSYEATVTQGLSPEAELLDFQFTAAANTALESGVSGTIEENTVSVEVPYDTGVADLIATFNTNGEAVTVGDTVQESGITPNDFTDPVTYTVTAEDGTVREYTVTVTIAEPSSGKEITAYSFPAAGNAALYREVSGSISGTDISVIVPFDTDVTALTAAFSITGDSASAGGTLQESGITVNDFTDPVVYTITAEDGSTQDYTVTVSMSAAAEGEGFVTAGQPGDSGIFLLGDREELITMVYAQNRESIAVPVGYTAEVPTDEPNSNYDDGEAILTVPFWMGETEVTNAAAAAVFNWAVTNGRLSSDVSDHNGWDSTTVKYGGRELLDLDHSECRITSAKGFLVNDSFYENHPVTNLSWYGAVMICNWLTEMRDGHAGNVVYTGIDTTWEEHETAADTSKTGYRLPSSDEWEYAARYRGTDSTNTVSGYSDPYFTQGDSASGATADYTNSSACTEVAVVFVADEDEVKSLGIPGANTLGLYDMSGNVWEWCFTEGEAGRIDRGGGYDSPAANDLIIGDWYSGSSLEGRENLGFRLCRTAD